MNNKTYTTLQGIIILILIVLCVSMALNGQNLHCSECQIHFRADRTDYKEITNKSMQDFTINMSDLVLNYQNNHCLIKKDQVFIIDNADSTDF